MAKKRITILNPLKEGGMHNKNLPATQKKNSPDKKKNYKKNPPKKGMEMNAPAILTLTASGGLTFFAAYAAERQVAATTFHRVLMDTSKTSKQSVASYFAVNSAVALGTGLLVWAAEGYVLKEYILKNRSGRAAQSMKAAQFWGGMLGVIGAVFMPLMGLFKSYTSDDDRNAVANAERDRLGDAVEKTAKKINKASGGASTTPSTGETIRVQDWLTIKQQQPNQMGYYQDPSTGDWLTIMPSTSDWLTIQQQRA